MSRPIKGVARVGERTKELVNRLKPGEIAVINHLDLDEVAAASLYSAKVCAVLNRQPFISGRYPNKGPLFLMERGVLLCTADSESLGQVDGCLVELDLSSGSLRAKEMNIPVRVYSRQELEADLTRARDNLSSELTKFVSNTLEYATAELGLITGEYPVPDVGVPISGRHVLVVVRGRDYHEDLAALSSYIEEVRPVLIGVDGGADALREFGWKPDIIVGDMDSVSDASLACGAELIVHGYLKGDAPGFKRLAALGLSGAIWKIPGTSEDLALLLAYENKAELIVAVGSHSNMIDFLDKGRPGMGSTFLVRLKVGEILVDAKGVNALYKGRIRATYVLPILVAAGLPFLVLLSTTEPLRSLVRLLVMYVRASLGF